MNERSFHLVMGACLFASTFVDRAARSVMPSWDPPAVSLLSLVLGLIWVGLFAAYRIRLAHEQITVLKDRAERAERKLNGLEDELRRLNGGR